MNKRRRLFWLFLLAVPLLLLSSCTLMTEGTNAETAKDSELVDALPVDTEVIKQDPYEAYARFLIDENRSMYSPAMKEMTLSRGNDHAHEGKTLLLQKEHKENPIFVEQKWDLSFVSLDLMASLLDFQFTWILPQKELLLVKNMEEGRLLASLSIDSRNALVEFQTEQFHQSQVQLLGKPYRNAKDQLMMPMEDLLKITGYDIAFSGEDQVEITDPKEGDRKLHILSYLDENEEKRNAGFFSELEKAQVEKEASFILLGDMALGSGYGRKHAFDDLWLAHGGAHFLSHLKADFDAADMVITNLENVYTERTAHQPGKIYTYKAHRVDYLDVLTEGGITHVNVVNNHMVDFLQEGFDDTLQYLDEYGIEYFGTNLTKSDNIELGSIEVESYSVFEKDGLKVGMLGYLGFNTSHVSDEKIQEDIRMMKEVEQVDYILAAMHWGGQETYEVTWKQKEMGRKLVDYGVDLVYGNHPHVLQEVEIYNGKPIYYSLGNFMFLAYTNIADPDGIMVKVNLEKDAYGEIHASFTHTPILWSGAPSKNTYMPKPMEDPAMIRRALDKMKVPTSEPVQFR